MDARPETRVRTLDNGMAVIAERMPGLRSGAMELHLPAGGASDPVDRCGSATVLAEVALRGAGTRNARQLTEHLDDLGLWRGSGVGTLSTRFTAGGLAANVLAGLDAHADVVRRPHLGDDAVGPSVELARQNLVSQSDTPQGLAMLRLREWAWPGPFSRNPSGDPHQLQKLTLEGLRDDFAGRWQPDGALLVVTGDVEPDAVFADAGRLFGDWKRVERPPLRVTPPPGRFHFVRQESNQTHVALAFATPAETASDYYHARLAIECLSGGMSGRLFDRIREREGLCYSVSASYASLAGPETGPSDADDFATVMCYAGTSNDRAQRTLDAVCRELRLLREGVTREELARARVGLKAGVVTSAESSAARAAFLARDYQTRGRVRPVEEVLAALEAVGVEALNAWLADHPLGPLTVVLVGPEPLDVPEV